MPLGEPRCRKCGRKQNQPNDTFVSAYSFCNKCHLKFMPFIREAMRKFINSGNRKGTGKKSWATRRKNIK